MDARKAWLFAPLHSHAMNERLTPGVLVALALVALIIVGSYWLARRHQRDAVQRSVRSTRSARKSPASGLGSSAMSALQLKNEVERLHAKNAGWPEILAVLNANNESNLHSELQAIRGPHMFAPMTALQVIEHGCDEVLRRSKESSAFAAVRSARQSMEKVTRYGD